MEQIENIETVSAQTADALPSQEGASQDHNSFAEHESARSKFREKLAELRDRSKAPRSSVGQHELHDIVSELLELLVTVE